MADLRVTVRYNDLLVEDKVVRVRDQVKIGDCQDAAVTFPGASVSVMRCGSELLVRGRTLLRGERTGFSLGQVKVELEHLSKMRLRPAGPVPLDLRFLLLALGVTTGGMWADWVAATYQSPPPGRLSAWVAGIDQVLPRGQERERREQVASVRPGDAPELLPLPQAQGDARAAVNDDQVSGIGYYRWYRAQVPSSLEAELARLRLDQDPSDTENRARVARGAYDNEDFSQALAHYRVLLEEHPGNTRYLWGRSQAEKRLGQHRAELATYRELLEKDPDNVGALGSGAVALARLGDFDAAEDWMRQALAAAGPVDPQLRMYEAMLLALQGRDSEALAAIEEAIVHREALPDGLQLELNRDLAIDPALASLRARSELRTLLWRQYGAAAPRKLRR
ncbi:MAG: tetratricopeptide repeat protein [Myxococcota bacterium]|nr:tetratricopeptide repeat protein [Myxococcota bacterium]